MSEKKSRGGIANAGPLTVKKHKSSKHTINIPDHWLSVLSELADEEHRNSIVEWLREDILRPIVLPRLKGERKISKAAPVYSLDDDD